MKLRIDSAYSPLPWYSGGGLGWGSKSAGVRNIQVWPARIHQAGPNAQPAPPAPFAPGNE